ncbi:hypothetical protein LUW75_22430 [Streptomyces sp. MRC013]|uniref:hypothetical protein n=1 Tax=Streptomyces sp. MRC013 TaxID=2898276 RepID=UPI002025C13C|nr:hypothetical protein [Streptomyces sp. MRC013]URM92254.1 hypothetical protein LUW75_22430 [Streptomyces sp. MRC013]
MGTRYPGKGAKAIPTQELRTALLALNGTGVPFDVRETGTGEADLLAEWRFLEPAHGSGATRRQVERTLKIWMRLCPGEREVRAMDEQWEVTRAGSPPGRIVARAHGRGPIRGIHKEWVLEKGPGGRRRRVETFSFNSQDLKDPLRNTVLGAGWTWRGVYKL